MSRRAQILDELRAVPAMPAAATRALMLLEDIEVDIAELVRSIEYDPGLTSNVLRVANSAYFGGRGTIGSLRDAMVRLGQKRLFQLVLMWAISPMARRPIKGYDIPPGQLLEHSIGAAIGVEQLARVLDLEPPDYTFTAALLHDLGKIVLGTFVEVDAGAIRDLAYQHELSFEVAEQRILGIDHAEVGAALLENWDLPSSIVAAVRHHHQPEKVKDDTTMVDLVHVSDLLCLETGVGVGIDGLNYHASREAATRLNLRISLVEEAACNMLKALGELRPLFAPDNGR